MIKSLVKFQTSILALLLFGNAARKKNLIKYNVIHVKVILENYPHDLICVSCDIIICTAHSKFTYDIGPACSNN